jgi:catalase (peroxidase I)
MTTEGSARSTTSLVAGNAQGLVAERTARRSAEPALHRSNPMGEDFDYAKEFKSLDYKALKKDLAA